MQQFLDSWHVASTATVGLFWMAFWAFGLGYLVSSMIQVFVTRARMRESMGDSGASSVALGTFFGFISSSCSFAALATTRSLFAKGAGLIPSLAFLLASTNLVIELGIVIGVFLGWQFVVGEYVGGILLILLMWLAVKLTLPPDLTDAARQRAREAGSSQESDDASNWRKLLLSRAGWRQVANRYVMEWHMVWKEVAFGFTVAGIIAAFVPRRFFQSLFIGAGQTDLGFWELLLQAMVGPLAAFFTFIGSMGNIPLAAVLFENGVSFAGVMAFIFSDLVVLPVLRIQARYYGWRMALYILGIFFVILVSSALLMHYGLAAAGILPDATAAKSVTDRKFFAVDYTLFLNLVFFLLSIAFLAWHLNARGLPQGDDTLSERVLFVLACAGLCWVAVGLSLPLFT